MPFVEGRHDGRRINLDIEVLGSASPTDLTSVRAKALLDTGATASAITPRIVDRLGLHSIGKRPVMVATEQRLVDFYVFRLGVRPEDATSPLPYIFAETVGFQISQTHDFEVLLGMDVLGQCDLSVIRDGTWRLQFGA